MLGLARPNVIEKAQLSFIIGGAFKEENSGLHHKAKEI
jgi:hypothetical protein